MTGQSETSTGMRARMLRTRPLTRARHEKSAVRASSTDTLIDVAVEHGIRVMFYRGGPKSTWRPRKNSPQLGMTEPDTVCAFSRTSWGTSSTATAPGWTAERSPERGVGPRKSSSPWTSTTQPNLPSARNRRGSPPSWVSLLTSSPRGGDAYERITRS